MARPPRTCEQPGCYNRHNARGMCKQHYKIWMLAQLPDRQTPVVEEFDYEDYWQFVKKELKIA